NLDRRQLAIPNTPLQFIHAEISDLRLHKTSCYINETNDLARQIALVRATKGFARADSCLRRCCMHNRRTWNLSVLAIGMLMTGRSMAAGAVVPGGMIDFTFGRNGLVTTDIGASDSIADMAIQLDGRIVVVGSTTTLTSGNDFVVA